MQVINKFKNNNSIEYKFLGIPIYKKEKFISSKSYYLLGWCFLKIKTLPHKKFVYFSGIKIKKKKIDIISKIRPYANGKDFIYYCFHTGEFYYLCQIIKANIKIFKDTVIITNFKELRQVLSLFEFEESWIEEHFIVVPNLWYFSYAVHCKSDGSILSQMELDHEKGWVVNGKLQKFKNKYLPINKIIQNFLGFNTIDVPQIKNQQERQKTVFLLPESQFNGNLDNKFIESMVFNLTNSGYKVSINTKSNKYDYLLNENVSKIFLSYRDTFNFASSCAVIIGVRSGLFDCLQNVVNSGVKVFCIYTKNHYPHYNHFKNFYNWFKSVYSFNKINNTNNYNEYFYTNNNELLIDEIINKIQKG